jgi:predicted HicB family RNase H-like nuclease
MNSLKERDQLTLRLTKTLNQRISQKARDMGISVNAYISMVLAMEAGNSSPYEDKSLVGDPRGR